MVKELCEKVLVVKRVSDRKLYEIADTEVTNL